MRSVQSSLYSACDCEMNLQHGYFQRWWWETFYLVTIIPFCSELILIRDQWITSDAIVWSDKQQNTWSASRLSTALALAKMHCWLSSMWIHLTKPAPQSCKSVDSKSTVCHDKWTRHDYSLAKSWAQSSMWSSSALCLCVDANDSKAVKMFRDVSQTR